MIKLYALECRNLIFRRVFTESMTSEDVRVRELTPLMKINDNYEKIVLSMNTGLDSSYEGIKSINVIDWLMEDQG